MGGREGGCPPSECAIPGRRGCLPPARRRSRRARPPASEPGHPGEVRKAKRIRLHSAVPCPSKRMALHIASAASATRIRASVTGAADARAVRSRDIAGSVIAEPLANTAGGRWSPLDEAAARPSATMARRGIRARRAPGHSRVRNRNGSWPGSDERGKLGLPPSGGRL